MVLVQGPTEMRFLMGELPLHAAQQCGCILTNRQTMENFSGSSSLPAASISFIFPTRLAASISLSGHALGSGPDPRKEVRERDYMGMSNTKKSAHPFRALQYRARCNLPPLL